MPMGSSGLPQTVFVDADGTIVGAVAGELDEASLVKELRRLTRDSRVT